DFYERYSEATNYKGEFAQQAPSDAVVLRLGLGQEEQAPVAAAEFNRYSGAQKPEHAAQVPFAVAAHYGEKKDWGSVQKRLGGAMNLIDRKATLDVRLQAHALLGRAYSMQKKGGPVRQSFGKVVGLWKDPQKGVAEIEKSGGDDKQRRRGRALEAVGEAIFFFAEEKKAKVEKVKFPEYRGTGSKEAVLKHINTKVKDWIQKKRPLIEEATAEYKKIVDLQPGPQPSWVIAAGSRIVEM